MTHHIRSPSSNPISQIDMSDIRSHKGKITSRLQYFSSSTGLFTIRLGKDLCSKIPSNLSCYQLIIESMHDM